MSHYVSITKEIKEKKLRNMRQEEFPATATRINQILDDLDMNAVTIEPTGYIWGKGKEREYHQGIKISYALEDGELNIGEHLRLGALLYAVNKLYAGAKAMVTIDGNTIPFFPGSHSE